MPKTPADSRPAWGKAVSVDADAPELPVRSLDVLRKRRSAKWQTYPADVLPLTVAEMDFDLAAPVADALHEAVERSDAGYAMPGPDLGRALAGFAAGRWDWEIDPMSVTAVTDVGVGVVELLRLLIRPGDAVVISPPVYPPFFDWVAEAGARLVEVPLAHDAAGWRLDLAALETAGNGVGRATHRGARGGRDLVLGRLLELRDELAIGCREATGDHDVDVGCACRAGKQHKGNAEHCPPGSDLSHNLEPLCEKSSAGWRRAGIVAHVRALHHGMVAEATAG